MGFDFNELDVGEDPDEIPGSSDWAPVEKVFQFNQSEVQEEPTPVSSSLEQSGSAVFDEHMSEVERRLELASYYRLLLNNSLFQDASASAATVDAEIRLFIKSRLSALLNIQDPSEKKSRNVVAKESSVFSEDETTALKALAGRILANPKVMALPQAPKQLEKPKETVRKPELRKVSTESIKAHQPKAVVAVVPQVFTQALQPNQPTAVSSATQQAATPKRGRASTRHSPHAMPMPSPSSMERMMNEQASQGGMRATGGGGIVSHIINNTLSAKTDQ